MGLLDHATHWFALRRPSVDQAIGSRIRECRQASGISGGSLEGRLGVSPGTISRFESGQKRVSPAQLFSLAKIFDVSVADFFQSESHVA